MHVSSQHVWAWLVAISISLMNAGSLPAQSLWEVTPYQVHVWMALASDPDVPVRWRDELPEQIAKRTAALVHAVWDCRVQLAPEGIATDLLERLDEITADEVFARDSQLETADKLMLVAFGGGPDGYHLRVRELDCRTHVWNAAVSSTTPFGSTLAEDATRAIIESFTALARIDRVDDKTVRALLRAGALARQPDSPALLDAGAVLQPIERRVDRAGRPRPGGVRAIPWTYARVQSRDGGQLQCAIVSGYRQPFTARRSRSVEQLALAVRPEAASTTLSLTSRSEPAQPLAGYEVYARASDDSDAELIGQTNWEGQLEIPRRGEVLSVLYVKHGDQLLARLPLVPGSCGQAIARLADDRERLETEGFLDGIRVNLVDMVARRENLALRIRKRIAEGELEAADRLLERMRALPTQDDFRRRIEQQRRNLTTTDDALRRQIDTLFADAYRLLGQHLDPRRIRELQDELNRARQPLSSVGAAEPRSP